MTTVVRLVVADKTLPHQLILNNVSGNRKLAVSCNCMPSIRGTDHRRAMELVAQGTELVDIWALWLTGRHRTHDAPFDHNAIAAARASKSYRLP